MFCQAKKSKVFCLVDCCLGMAEKIRHVFHVHNQVFWPLCFVKSLCCSPACVTFSPAFCGPCVCSGFLEAACCSALTWPIPCVILLIAILTILSSTSHPTNASHLQMCLHFEREINRLSHGTRFIAKNNY